MALEIWRMVRTDLGHEPIATAIIGGELPLFVERYVYQDIERTVRGLDQLGLVTQFGGGRVREGDSAAWRGDSLPTHSMLVPRNTPTHWHYSGTVDFAVFYLQASEHPLARNLDELATARGAPQQFADPLVGAAARQIVTELHKGASADFGFLERLGALMLEQTYRVLTTPAGGGIDPRHAHYARLQRVLNHLPKHLSDPLDATSLARLADVSVAHFRRMFQEATGLPPHRYVLSLRLERARVLLTQSSLPIARIAQECGFASQSHLTAAFRAAHAATPAQFRAARKSG